MHSQPCPQPQLGACCLANGSCLALLQADCDLQGGAFRGERAASRSSPGACCTRAGTVSRPCRPSASRRTACSSARKSDEDPTPAVSEDDEQANARGGQNARRFCFYRLVENLNGIVTSDSTARLLRNAG